MILRDRAKSDKSDSYIQKMTQSVLTNIRIILFPARENHWSRLHNDFKIYAIKLMETVGSKFK